MLRYYPKSKIKTNLIASGKNLYLDGKLYVGKYYETYDGKLFSGANPIIGENRLLSRASEYETIISDANNGNSNTNIINKTSDIFEKRIISSLNNANRISSKPVSYFPKPLPEDYTKGYITRYFIKGINQNGYITEISPTEYANFEDGTVNYDVSLYLVGQLNWKLIGPLNSIRLSQYDIRMGIIDMNKKQTENLNKTFLGITQYIAENYTQFARPTK